MTHTAPPFIIYNDELYLTRAQHESSIWPPIYFFPPSPSPCSLPATAYIGCEHARFHTRNSILQIHQNVIAPPEQPHHHRLYVDLQQRYLPRTRLAIIERGGVSVYLHGQSVAADGRFLAGIRLHVLENLAGSFHIHRREAQQKGSSLSTT